MRVLGGLAALPSAPTAAWRPCRRSRSSHMRPALHIYSHCWRGSFTHACPGLLPTACSDTPTPPPPPLTWQEDLNMSLIEFEFIPLRQLE